MNIKPECKSINVCFYRSRVQALFPRLDAVTLSINVVKPQINVLTFCFLFYMDTTNEM